MIRVALRGLLGRKLRAALTALSIVLGVAMISGTYVLTDTIRAGFNTIFTQSYQNSDVVISGKVAFSGNSGAGVSPGFPAGVLAKVRALPDVAAAAGSVTDDHTQLVKADGKSIETNGAPALGLSVDPKEDQRFNPLSLVSGGYPATPSQIAIDQGTSNSEGLHVGDAIGVATNGPVRQFEITGIVKFGGVSSIGSASIAVFDEPTAQQLFGKEGKLDLVRIAGKAGVPTAKLLSEIRPLLPPTAQVKSASAQAKSDSHDVSGFLNFLQKFLLAFGGIALFVGSFVIANTLSITIAQRTREFATMRTIGASRRQVLRSVILEALVIGILGSVAGLFLGLGLAKGLNALFVAVGIDLPKSSTIFAQRTVIVSLVVGTLITLLASLRPALRATRVPPIAAVREGAVLPTSRLARFGPATALVVLVLSIGLLVYGVFGHHLATPVRLLSLGGGVLLLFFAVAINAKRLVRPLASVLGWPGTKMAGVSGELARDNAMRNPSRTASTASALMIGLALITFVAVLGQGILSSFEDAVDKLFVADYALTAQDGFTPLTKEATEAIRHTPGLLAVSGVRAGDGRFFGNTEFVTGVDAQLSKVVKIDWYRGSEQVPAQLGRDGAFIEKKVAKKHHLTIGSPISLETPTGQTLHLKVKGIFKEPKGGSPFGTVTVSTEAFDSAYTQPKNLYTFMQMKGGVTEGNTARLELTVNGFPDAKVQTQSQFKANQEKFLLKILKLLYVLLALSVVISLFGIVNTLVLTIFERTRELGMLRAVGMTRRQTRRMIRHESIVTSLIGATLGIALGIFLSVLVTQALSSEGIVFAVPYLQLVYFVIAAIVVGILAAILPARRAARLNVLEALQYE